MGFYPLIPGVEYIASSDTWMEGLALQQLQTTAQLAGMQSVVGMPDLHPGRGYPIGAAFFADRVYPSLVGSDIGCGMGLWQTTSKKHQWSGAKCAKKIDSIDGPLEGDGWHAFIQQTLEQYGCSVDARYHAALGTIGGGNHFAEIQTIDTLYMPEVASTLGLDPSCLLLMVHSGSRGLGYETLQKFLREFQHQGLQGSDAEAYFFSHQQAIAYAQANRQVIAERLKQRLRTEAISICDGSHNFVVPMTIDGVSGWLHRKGASDAHQSVLLLPGSRGHYTYVLQPILSPRSLFSIAHGAGRKWLRQDCKARLSHQYRVADLERTALGSTVVCGNKALLYEEAPQAYKDVEVVVEALESAGLVRRIARLRPMLTYKTRGECAEC